MKRLKIISISLLILIGIFGLCFYIYSWENREPLFETHFFSLNRGRAIFMRTPEQKTILVGGGQNSDTIRELTKVMPFYSRKVHYLFIPAATPAQVGGLIEIVDRYEIEEIILPKIMGTSTVLTQVMKEVRKKKIHIQEVEAGDTLEIRGLHIEIVFPYEVFKYNKTSLPELGLVVSYKDTAVYLMGNLSKTIQKNILKNLKGHTKENLLEFYNSAGESLVSEELVEFLGPKFIFSTKEKTTSFVSDGFSWKRE